MNSVKDDGAWFYPVNAPTGAVLLLHGLNLLPSKMDALALKFSAWGLAVLRPVLKGHHPGIEALKSVRYLEWNDDIQRAFESLQERYPGLPLFIVGHSLGALLFADFLADARQRQARTGTGMKMVFLAPAFSFRPWTGMLSHLAPFHHLVIPSFSPRDHRVHAGTPVAAYLALLAARKRLLSNLKLLAHDQVLIMMNKKDELVSWPGTENLIRDFGLRCWKLEEIAGTSKRNHLIVGPELLSHDSWGLLLGKIAAHLLS